MKADAGKRVYNDAMASVTGARGPIISGLVVGFILGSYLGSLIDHQLFFGLWSFCLGIVGAGGGIWIGVKVSQHM